MREARELLDQGMSRPEVAKKLCISHSTVYRAAVSFEKEDEDKRSKYKGYRGTLGVQQRVYLRALVRGEEPVKAAMTAGCNTKAEAWRFIKANDRNPAFRSELKRIVEKTQLNDQFFMDKLIELLSIKKPFSYLNEQGKRVVEHIPEGASIAAGLKIWGELKDRLGDDEGGSGGVVVRVDGLRELMKCTGMSAQQLMESGKIRAIEITGEPIDAEAIDATPREIEGATSE